MIMLSPHFSLEEMTFTGHHGIDNTPDDGAMFSLVRLCNDFLEVVRAKFGPLRITSGYRSQELNAAIPGSAKDSAHSYGCAADLQSIEGYNVTEMVRWVAIESGLDFDQCIDETKGSGRWMHLAMLRPHHEAKPRRQTLTYRDGKYTDFTD
jgi:zinc D-Ala-D-Ala carboxypeptidase